MLFRTTLELPLVCMKFNSLGLLGVSVKDVKLQLYGLQKGNTFTLPGHKVYSPLKTCGPTWELGLPWTCSGFIVAISSSDSSLVTRKALLDSASPGEILVIPLYLSSA